MYVPSGCRICESILIFFALFVKIKSLELPQTRCTQPLKGIDMDILMEKVFYHTTDELKEEVGIVFRAQEIKVTAIERKDAKTFYNILESNLSTMEQMFTDVVYNYITKIIWKYCKAVLGLIDNKREPDITQDDIVKYSLLESDEYYYVIEFLHGYSYNVSGILETIWFFQTWPYTIANSVEQADHEKFTKVSMQKKITEFINDLRLVGESKFGDGSEQFINNLIYRRVIIREGLSNLTLEFMMDPIKPIVNKYLYIPKENKDGGERNLDLSDFIYKTEECEITFAATGSLVTQIVKISSWNCNGIQSSPQYQINSYLNEIKEEQPLKKAKMSDKDKSKLYFTLKLLHLFMKQEAYYLNAVQYRNIEADAIILSAIKEGTKIMEAIKTLIPCSNIDDTELSVEDILSMRMSLFMFRIHFDDMINFMMAHIPLFINIQQFIYDTDKLLKYLDIKNLTAFKHLKSYCQFINYILNDKENAIISADKEKIVLLYEYYMYNPVTNMYRLNEFYKSTMK